MVNPPKKESWIWIHPNLQRPHDTYLSAFPNLGGVLRLFLSSQDTQEVRKVGRTETVGIHLRPARFGRFGPRLPKRDTHEGGFAHHRLQLRS